MDIQTVQPESEDTGLSLTLGVKVVNVGLFFLGDGIKTRVGVEQVGDESKVKLGVTSDERVW